MQAAVLAAGISVVVEPWCREDVQARALTWGRLWSAFLGSTPTSVGMDSRMEEFLGYARRAYGDLQKPDYMFFSEALRTRPYEGLMDRFREFVRVEDWTDREDDVSFSCVLRVRRGPAGWLLWLSAVGPFAFLVYGPAEDDIVRSDVVTGVRDDGLAEETRIVSLLRDDGFRLLSAADVESTVNEFRPWDGRFPASLFVLLFGDTDVPWWHAS